MKGASTKKIKSKGVMHPQPWRVELLGGILAERGTRRTTKFSTRQTAGLLALLAQAAPLGVPRDEVTARLWGEGDRQTLRNRLSQAVSTLRKLLESGEERVFSSTHFALAFKPGTVTVDVHEFEATMERLASAEDADERLELAVQAAALYKGDYLAGYRFPWAEADRSRLKSMLLIALDVAIQGHEEAGRIQRAVDVAFRRLHAEPADPASLLKLCGLLLKFGRPSQVAQLIHAHEARLPEGTRLDPALEAVRAQAVALPRSGTRELDPSVQVSHSFRPNPLPAYPKPIVGREVELSRLGEVLSGSERRLVSVTGMGGSGKSRVAVAAAEEHIERNGGWVAYMTVGSGAPLLSSIGTSLGLGSTDRIEGIADAVGAGTSGLLVVDEAEHLDKAAVKAVDQLLTALPKLKVLATSRAPLELPMEAVFPLSPLRVAKLPGEEASPAARLFLECLDRPESLKPSDLDAVQEFCEMVDGLPLSIKLAAGWVRVLSVSEIVERLQHEPAILRDASLPPTSRHASVQHVVSSTLDLIKEPTRSVMSRIAAFEGPFAPAILDRVAGSGTLTSLLELEAIGVLHQAGSVADRTMMAMLGTVRRVVRERWTDEERATALESHRSVMLADALMHAGDTEKGRNDGALAAHFAEHVAAIRRSIELGWADDAVRHATVVSRICETGGTSRGCTELLEAALGMDGITDAFALRGRAVLARLYWVGSEYAKAKELASRLLQEAHKAGNFEAETVSTSVLQMEAHRVGDYATSESLLQSSLDAALGRNDHDGAARSWLGLGNLAMERMEWSEAEEAYSNSLESARRAQATDRRIAAHVNLAHLAMATQRHLAAVEFARRALRLVAESPGFARLGAAANVVATQAHAALGDRSEALESLERALETPPESGRELVALLTAAADASIVASQARLGAQLLGFIDGYVAKWENPGGLEGANRAAIAARCEAEIGEKPFESLYMAGKVIGREQALDLARQVAHNGTACVV